MNIELRNIHKRFGPVHANNAISVSFNEGRIIGVLGENGAGKSTLMKILSGFQPADEGDILINGQVVDYTGPTAAIANGIGMLQQDPLDVGAFTVIENFIYGSSNGLLLQSKAAESKLADFVKRFQFELDPHSPIDNLSIAQRQQLEIIRLLALGVKTLILDEPTTGISAEQKDTLFDALRKLARNEGMIVLLVSHKLEDVIDLCDEVVVLRAGKLVGALDMPETDENLTGAVIAKTKSELVTLMFGEELGAQTREAIQLGEPVLITDSMVVHDLRLQMQAISLEIHAGEVIGLAGLDGSGQELFMRACAGLASVHSGKITIHDTVMSNIAARAPHKKSGENAPFGILRAFVRAWFQPGNQQYLNYRRKGVLFGAAGRIEEGLIAGLTLTEHTALVMGDDRRIDWKAVQKRTIEQIERFRVRGRPTDNIEQLSGGNQQRVLMGLLPDDAQLLILEQPTRGLDVDSARWIWKQLLDRRESGTAILFNSAELDELVAYSDRILVFYAGRMVEVADVSQTSIDELGHLIGGEFKGKS